MKVLGMGNALIDVLVRVKDDNVFQSMGLVKGGMTLIDEEKFKQISQEFEKMETSIVSGGSAANAIVGLANLDILTGFVGRVGSDIYGNLFKKDLMQYGVCPHLTYADEISGVASTFISEGGERTFGTFLGAAALLDEEDLSIEDFRGYDLFYIEGYLVQSYALIRRAMQLAKEAGLMIALDLASYNVVEANKDFLLTIIPKYVDIVFANEEEARAMFGQDPEIAVEQLSEMTRLAVVKAGKNGSWVQRGAYKVHVDSTPNITCLDATGAGDLYAAGFLYGIANEKDLEISAKMGTLLAEEVIQHIGPKIPLERWGHLKEEINKL